jgi:hypothetical protein
MVFVPLVVLICEFIQYTVDFNVAIALVIFGVATVLTAIFAWVMGDKLYPLPPLPDGFVQPMWVVVVTYPIYALYFLTLVARFF